MNIYFFGWPSELGGAGTKLAHLLRLLRGEFEITVVPTVEKEAADTRWQQRIEALGARWMRFEQLPPQLEGWGVLLCNHLMIRPGTLGELRRRGLRLAWSNEMMWTTREELGPLAFGQFDAVLYVSPEQRTALEPQYLHMLTGLRPPAPERVDERATEGWLAGRRVRWVMTGNYIDPAEFPFHERPRGTPPRPLVVGRLSRADADKFPEKFPESYAGLGLKDARFRVMGWGGKIAEQWPRKRFDGRWELLPPCAEPTAAFLQSLDLFVYELGASCCESWGRAVVEAMLTGAVPLVPADRRHHLHALVPHGQAGFHCATRAEFGHYARRLEADDALRLKMSRQARAWAEKKLCNTEEHRERWRRLFHGGAG